ncbi:pyridoxamine 5'-phosphate oxidase family protein [Desulfonema magnum]|uniref:Pyridoxamine 5'-phosphate oxidase domain-containing protein n=1 Tax=Desulfonema magnum TaxID=45655 RepID=A0A975BQS2_9BACT|nr:pyridoxamine 5'-phosphate oxidase family protein [Desulfonema magnum]QTA89762.1 Pyridoxamine 5'-phosphate oxidase domain-containing protein [Desulfonema magnum]
MRRKDKEITNRAEIESVIERSEVCRLGLADDGYPYVVPLCFGYKDNSLYFHSAQKGRKTDILRKNNKVCFEFDIDHEIKSDENACKWGMKYKSVIGFGEASFPDDPESKRKALDIIMRHYSDRSFDYSETKLKNTLIIKVDIQQVTGKQGE